MTDHPTSDGIAKRITDYLVGGGLVNPELAKHTAVRDLLIDCRDEIERLTKALKTSNKALWCLAGAPRSAKSTIKIAGTAIIESEKQLRGGPL